MLGLPERGVNRSVNTHNSDLAVICDWIEASLLFTDDQISKTDITDTLLENEVYDTQDFALEFVDSVWSVMQARVTALNGALGLEWSRDRLRRIGQWEDFPAYAFCLEVACASYVYPKWAADYGHESAVQGSLFERIAHRSFSFMLPGWKVVKVGWTPDNPVKLNSTISDLITSINEIASADMHLHVDGNANELGLDLLAFYSFGDVHSSTPLIMVQCASGKDWKSKRHTPDLALWNKVVNFNSHPLKGFVIPYSFTDGQEFRREATRVNGLFMDRYRLLNPNRGQDVIWNERELNDDLVNWIRPRVDAMPRIEV